MCRVSVWMNHSLQGHEVLFSAVSHQGDMQHAVMVQV